MDNVNNVHEGVGSDVQSDSAGDISSPPTPGLEVNTRNRTQSPTTSQTYVELGTVERRSGILGPELAIEELTRLLENDEIVEDLLRADFLALTAEHRMRLGEIYRNFQPPAVQGEVEQDGQPVDEENDNDDEDDERPARKRKRETKIKKSIFTRNPWQRVMNMTVLTMPSSLAENLGREDFDIEAWMSDNNALVSRAFHYNSAQIGDAFQACYRYTLALQSRVEEDQIRRCFTLLFWQDLVRLIRPQGSGGVGPLVIQEVVNFLQPLGALNGQDMAVEDIRRNLNAWSNTGRKLAHMCQVFNPGCLFILAKYFSDDFLKNKCPIEGKYYDDAVQHLRDLGVRANLLQTGAARAGLRLRQSFIEPFQEAHRRQNPGTQGQA